ncbi:MAG TPA: choice-of-anchor D domain-containing protein [Terriglobales bacterium]|nr:choice-of-anchor D domain-containing protein [Terriglobales bacterium]
MNDEIQPVLKRRIAIHVEEIAMRYFKLMVCTGILLLLSGAASAQQDYIVGFAGGGPNNLPATSMGLYSQPANVALDSAGNVYFTAGYSEYPWENRVWKVTKSTGIMTIVAGTYYYGYSGDGGPAVDAQLDTPDGIAVDYLGNVFIADAYNHIIREVNASTGNISTIAGTPQIYGFSGDGGPATSAWLYIPAGLGIDKNGNLFIADTINQRIRMVACATVTSTGGTCTPNAGQTTGYIYTAAGTGSGNPYNGDNQSATSANLYDPEAVTADTAGNLYIADSYDNLIRRVACGTGISGCTAPSGETAGYIYTLAGTGESPGHPGTNGYNGDGILATTAELAWPVGLTVDNSGNLFVADFSNFRVREVSCVTKTSSGGACSPNAGQVPNNIYTVAGTGTIGYNGDNQAATTAELDYTDGIAVDSAGNLFIVDTQNYIVREVPCSTSQLACTPPAGETARYIYTVAGSYDALPFVNNVPATAEMLFYPSGAASDSVGNIYIAENQGCVVYEVSASTGNISNFAGTLGTCKYGGDGGPATSAYLAWPSKVAVDNLDNVYIADEYNCVIRKVSGGVISTFAGTPDSCGYGGDGGAATSAQLLDPTGVAVDSSGNVYIADQANNVVRKVSGGTISTFAGNHTLGAGYSGDDGLATSAQLYNPADVAVDSAGNVYIADEINQRIRKVNPSGIITTYAGNGATGYQGDGIPANETSLYDPQGVAVDLFGDVVIADYGNNRVRFVDQGGVIHTIAGGGSTFGNYIPATTAELNQPTDVGVDPWGNIYIADYGYWLVRKVNALAMLFPSPASVTFEEQPIKTTSLPLSVTLTSNGPADIASITASAGFNEIDDCPSTLTSSTCMVDVTFSPTVAGVINGTLTISYNGFFSQETVVNLQGTGTAVTLTPLSLGFGSLHLSNSVTKTVTVKGATTYAATSATLSGDSTDFTIASNNCIGSVTTSCVIGVTFEPLSTGAKKATLVIHDNDPTNPQLVGLTGTGTSYEMFTPSSVTFKPQTINQISPDTTVTFKYTGSSTLTLTSLVASTHFGVEVLGITSGACNLTGNTLLSTNQSCSFHVFFSPGTTTGTITGTVTANFTGDPGGLTSQQLPLSGAGTQVQLSPTTMAFGTVATTGTTQVTVVNRGTTPLNFTSAPTITGTGAAKFAVLPYNATGPVSTCLNGAVMLTQDQACTYGVVFTNAGSTATATANLNIFDNGGGSPQWVAMNGTGTEVSMSPLTLAFGTVPSGSKTLSVTVENIGTTPLTFSKAPIVTGTGAVHFVVQPYSATGPVSTCLNGTVTLTQNQTCTYTVTFTNAGGSTYFQPKLNVYDNGGGSPQIEWMSATD